MTHLIRVFVGALCLLGFGTIIALLVRHFAIVFPVVWLVGVSYALGWVVESIRAEMKWKRAQ